MILILQFSRKTSYEADKATCP